MVLKRLWVVDAKCSCAKKLGDAKNMTTGAKNNCAKSNAFCIIRIQMQN